MSPRGLFPLFSTAADYSADAQSAPRHTELTGIVAEECWLSTPPLGVNGFSTRGDERVGQHWQHHAPLKVFLGAAGIVATTCLSLSLSLSQAAYDGCFDGQGGLRGKAAVPSITRRLPVIQHASFTLCIGSQVVFCAGLSPRKEPPGPL